MQKTDVYDGNMMGRIRLYELGLNGETLLLARANVITYTAADILARLLAGNTDAFPQHIGFIYGEVASPGAAMADPDTLPLETRRVHDWSRITTDVADATGNMLICPLVLPPAVSLDANSNAGHFAANATTFTSHTGAFTEYAFPTTGGTFAGTLDSLGSVYFYHAVLLNRRKIGETITYTPFSRVTLGTQPYTAKAADRELAVYWDIVFK